MFYMFYVDEVHCLDGLCLSPFVKMSTVIEANGLILVSFIPIINVEYVQIRRLADVNFV